MNTKFDVSLQYIRYMRIVMQLKKHVFFFAKKTWVQKKKNTQKVFFILFFELATHLKEITSK